MLKGASLDENQQRNVPLKKLIIQILRTASLHVVSLACEETWYLLKSNVVRVCRCESLSVPCVWQRTTFVTRTLLPVSTFSKSDFVVSLQLLSQKCFSCHHMYGIRNAERDFVRRESTAQRPCTQHVSFLCLPLCVRRCRWQEADCT